MHHKAKIDEKAQHTGVCGNLRITFNAAIRIYQWGHLAEYADHLTKILENQHTL